MLSPRAQLNLRNAKSYFREHLCAGEYYAHAQKMTGEWFGQGAEKLGLKGAVKENQFLKLCEGRHPETDEWLTQRKNTQRQENGKIVANRRVFYDFTISPTKSVSIMALCRDDRIIEVHNQATRLMMLELEKFAQARVRKEGKRDERTTANVVGAMFRHDTSRELDPHLHTHCVVMNATFDSGEGAWKALEAVVMYRARKFSESLYYHEMGKGLLSLGYEIEHTAHGVEIKGLPPSLIQRFSKRHQQIDQGARKRIEKGDSSTDINNLRRQVAQSERKRKLKDSTADRLRPEWEEQMPANEKAALDVLRKVTPRNLERADPNQILTWADEQLFRASVSRAGL